jgi:hypothetical protein
MSSFPMLELITSSLSRSSLLDLHQTWHQYPATLQKTSHITRTRWWSWKKKTASVPFHQSWKPLFAPGNAGNPQAPTKALLMELLRTSRELQRRGVAVSDALHIRKTSGVHTHIPNIKCWWCAEGAQTQPNELEIGRARAQWEAVEMVRAAVEEDRCTERAMRSKRRRLHMAWRCETTQYAWLQANPQAYLPPRAGSSFPSSANPDPARYSSWRTGRPAGRLLASGTWPTFPRVARVSYSSPLIMHFSIQNQCPTYNYIYTTLNEWNIPSNMFVELKSTLYKCYTYKC